jgi:hypothetical protein
MLRTTQRAFDVSARAADCAAATTATAANAALANVDMATSVSRKINHLLLRRNQADVREIPTDFQQR